jgi:hypothetical protein
LPQHVIQTAKGVLDSEFRRNRLRSSSIRVRHSHQAGPTNQAADILRVALAHSSHSEYSHPEASHSTSPEKS